MRSNRRKWILGVSLCGLAIAGLAGLLLPWRSRARPHIVALAGDLRNGGVLGVVIGIEQACEALDWELTVLDVSRSNLSSSQEGFVDGYRHAFALRPDGLVLVSGNIEQPYHVENLARAEQLGIPVVGWHVAPVPGPVPESPVRVNVATPSHAVADAAAALVVPAADEPEAGVVVFTDTTIDFARGKSDEMLAVLKRCERCTVLSVEDIPLGQAATLVPPAVRRLLATYGARWTHSLAINDLYYDYAIRELVASNWSPPANISAGDGSPAALLRIRYHSFQYASVAEPLLQQGWQLVDELHRIFHGQPPSGYVNPAYVVTQENVARMDAGRRLAERICGAIRSLDIEAIAEPVTLSVGLVAIPSDADAMEPWLKAADQALYAAKAQGRDRVVVADPQAGDGGGDTGGERG